MANVPRGSMRPPNVGELGQSVFQGQAQAALAGNRLTTYGAIPVLPQAAGDMAHQGALAANTAAHGAAQAEFQQAAGHLANSAAQACCLKHRYGTLPPGRQQVALDSLRGLRELLG